MKLAIPCSVLFGALCFFTGTAFATEYGPPISEAELKASEKIPDETPEQVKAAKRIEEEIDGPENENSTDRFVTLDPNLEEDRNVITDNRFKWPSNIVPYKITTQYSQQERLVVAKAINTLQKHTCIRFRDATAKDMDKNTGGFLEFMKASGCWSYVGFLGPRRYKTETGEIVATSKQELSLGEGCYHSTTILHEIIHALGFSHEQARPDRDTFLEILWDNINKASQYKKRTDTTTYGTDYDYCSIMQYEQGAFGKRENGVTLKTMRVLKPNKKCADSLGLTPHPTDQDIRKINKLYECTEHASVGNDVKIKERECFDEMGETSCRRVAAFGGCEGTGATNAKKRRDCQKTCNLCSGREVTDVCLNYDKDAECEKMKCAGSCNPGITNYEYMKQSCRKACNFCNGGVTPKTICDAEPVASCRQKADDGDCEDNKWTQRHCAYTCKNYTPVCKNKWSDEQCRKRMCQGMCTTSEQMNKYCKKSCGVCGDTTPQICDAEDTSTCETFTEHGWCKKGHFNSDYMKRNCAKSCQTFKPACKDKISESQCKRFKCQQACSNKNHAYHERALFNCRATCQVCDGKTAPEFICDVEETSKCERYKKLGSCSYNKSYMERNCRATCSKKDTTTTTTTTTTTMTTTTTKKPACENKDTSCVYWARLNYCKERYVAYMSRVCPKACGVCK